MYRPCGPSVLLSITTKSDRLSLALTAKKPGKFRVRLDPARSGEAAGPVSGPATHVPAPKSHKNTATLGPGTGGSGENTSGADAWHVFQHLLLGQPGQGQLRHFEGIGKRFRSPNKPPSMAEGRVPVRRKPQ